MASTINAVTTGGGGVAITGDSSGNLAIQTNNGNTAITIDTSQNVGIGTSSPASTAMFEISRATTLIPTATVTADAQVVGWRVRRTGGTYPREYYMGIRENSTAWDFYDNTADALRMRIDSSGNLIINSTSRASAERVNITVDGNAQENLILVNTNTSAGNNTAIGFRRASATTVGTIVTTTSSTAYNTSSDYRLKDNVTPLIGGLEKVSQLNPVTWNWKADGSDGQGFIAHELQAVVPDCVTGEKDAVDEEGNPVYQGIDTSFLVATLTAAIQEQQAIITDLKARIEALEGASK